MYFRTLEQQLVVSHAAIASLGSETARSSPVF